VMTSATRTVWLSSQNRYGLIIAATDAAIAAAISAL
jgi:hypothetical protein